MKPGRIFWGLAFLSAGVFLLLDKLGVLCLGSSSVWRFWPVIILLLGIAMIMGRQSLRVSATGVAGLLLGFLVAALFCFGWGSTGRGDGLVDQEFTRPFEPAIREARLNLDAGAGTFTIAEPCTGLVEAKTSTSIGAYDFRSESDDSTVDVYVTMDGHKPGWRLSGWENRAMIRLNQRPEWRIDLDIGAARADLDLRRYRVRDLRLDAGAARVTLRLGTLCKNSDVRINAGASSILIEVPEGAGCEIRAEAPLSSKKFPGFERTGEGTYRSENYQGAEQKIAIRLDAGVSSLRVRRVEPF